MGYAGGKVVHDVQIRDGYDEEEQVVPEESGCPSVRVPSHEEVGEEQGTYPEMEF